MKYSEWVKRYCITETQNPIDALFDGIKRWNPELYAKLPPDAGFREAMDLLFTNGITEG